MKISILTIFEQSLSRCKKGRYFSTRKRNLFLNQYLSILPHEIKFHSACRHLVIISHSKVICPCGKSIFLISHMQLSLTKSEPTIWLLILYSTFLDAPSIAGSRSVCLLGHSGKGLCQMILITFISQAIFSGICCMQVWWVFNIW